MMNQKILMVATRMNSSKIKTAFAIFVALTFALACTSTTAYAKKKHKVRYGLVELTTNPGGFPLHIDGKPQGDTSTTVRVIELEPGYAPAHYKLGQLQLQEGQIKEAARSFQHAVDLDPADPTFRDALEQARRRSETR